MNVRPTKVPAAVRRRFGPRPAAPPPVADSPVSPAAGSPEAPGGKGRPTPKRRDTQTRRGPLAPPPANRREAYQRTRGSAKERRTEAREGLRRGDERYLPARDQGPVRRLVRDIVDSRRNALSLFLVSALVLFVGSTVKVPAIAGLSVLLWTASVIVMVADGLRLGLRIRGTVRERFPDAGGHRMRSLLFYGMTRATQFRRLRVPPPKVKVGTPV